MPTLEHYMCLFVVVFQFVFVVNNSFEVACGVCGVYVDA